MDKLHSLTRIASMAVSAWRFVDASGGHAANSASAIGISEQAAEVGKAYSAVTGYSAPVEAAEALNAGDLVKPAPDGSGRAVKGGSGDCCGRVLVGAAAGKLAEVRFLELAAVSGGGNVGLAAGTGAAAANLAACRAALSRGLLSIGAGLGVVVVSGTLVAPSYARIEVGAGTRLKAADGRAQPLILSQYTGLLHAAVHFTRASNVVSAVETGTWREIGQQLFINGGPDASYRGLVTITSVTTNGYTYASAGSNGTAGTAGQFYNVIPVRRTLAAAAFTAIGSGYVNVADPGHDLQPGDQVYIGNAVADAFAPGIVKVTRAADGQWTYFATGATGSPSGTYALSYDKDITITGDGYIDGNRVGVVVDAGNDMRLVTVSMGNVSGLRIDCKIGGSPMRGVNAYNCAAVTMDKRWASYDALVGFQAEGGVDGCVVDQGDMGDAQMYAGYPASVTVSGATNSGTTAVIDTATPHGLTSGTPLKMTGFTPAAYNVGTAQIVVASPTQFRYTMASNPGGAASVIGTYAAGQQADDYVAFTGTQYAAGAGGNYDSTISPYGLTYFAGIDVARVLASNALNGVKITSMAAAPFRGRLRIGSVRVRALDHDPRKAMGGAVRIMDDGPGLVATTMDSLQLDGPFEFVGPTTAGQSTAGLLQISGTGTINQISGRGYNGEGSATAAAHVTGMTIGMLDVDASKYGLLGTNKMPYQLLGGTIRKLQVRNSHLTVGTQQPLAYLGGATVHDIVLDNLLVIGETDGTGSLIDYGVAASLRSITLRGVRTPVGGNGIANIMSIGNVAAGTVDIFVDDCDIRSGSLVTTPGSGGSGTFNVHLGSRFRWAATGGNNLLQVGFGAWHLFGAPGCAVPADKLALFGFGAPTYRLHMPSDRATVNINSGNYIGGQMAPVNGDQLYNNNAGTLAIGPVVRRAGAWAAL